MARTAVRCLALAACSALPLGARIEAVEDRSALYQQGLHVHSAQPLKVKLTPPEMVQRLQAITGQEFSEEDFQGPSISVEPWQRLEKHGKVFQVLNEAVASLEGPVERFLWNTTERKAVLRRSSVTGKFSIKALAATVSPIVDEWRSIAGAVTSGLNISAADLGSSDVGDSILRIVSKVAAFDSKVEWLAASSLRRVPFWGELGDDMIPAQLEVMKTIISEFSEQKDQLLQTIREVFQEAAGYVSDDIREPFSLVGDGTCADAGGRRYSTFEAVGCETPLACVQGCRAFRSDQCRGATYQETKGCGHCELRMEANFSQARGVWGPAWRDGAGKGEVASAVAAAVAGTRCYKRETAEWWSWPKNVQSLLEQDMVTMQHNFAKLSRNFGALCFKIDRAFWQVETGFDFASPTVVSDWH